MSDVEPMSTGDLQTLRYEIVDPGDHGVAVITLDRPESRNAQNKRMTYELNGCFDDAARRDDVKVIVLQAAGPHGRPITDIAMSWGFGNLSHFSRVFREHTGASPSEFRNTPHAPSRMGQTPH